MRRVFFSLVLLLEYCILSHPKMKSTPALAAIAAASSVSALAVHERQSSPGYNCVPGTSCWPTDSEWQALNQSINGGLHATVPWAKPCFSGLSFGTDFKPRAMQLYSIALRRQPTPWPAIRLSRSCSRGSIRLEPEPAMGNLWSC